MSDGDKIQIASLTDECYERIKNDILGKRIKWGQRLSIRDLTERFGVSRSPVVKAIERLSHEGLVEIVPNKGSFVIVPTEKDIKEISDVRIAFELMACELAYQNGKEELLLAHLENEKHIIGFEQNKQQIPIEVWFKYDRNYHMIFAELADNKKLLDIHELNRNQLELFRLFYDELDAKRATEMHRKVLEYIRQDDLENALKALRQHIEEVSEDTMKDLHQALSE